MERSEPTLVPEWLKNAGNATTGSSASHSDDHPTPRDARKSSVNGNGHDFGRSSSSEGTTSSYFRRSSSSNSSGNFRSYINFGRNQRDRDLEKDASSILGGRRHRNVSDPLGDTALGKSGKDGLRRSQSMISAKRVDLWPKKVAADSGSANIKISNGLHTKGSPVARVSKAFERDFPSLGLDERAVISEIGRVPSPGISTAIQSLPIGTSASLGGEKWTSALAEVSMLVGSNGTASSSDLQATSASSASVALGSTACLNMAEAVAQGPSRAQTTAQSSVGAQRLEELAIKQSRQLIPMMPLMPKTLVLHSSDKQKSKGGSQQHSISSSLPVKHSPRGGPVKSDASKASNVGKLHVLKPVREKNGVSPSVMDNLSPTSSSSLAASPSVSVSAATKPPHNNVVSDQHKPVLTLLEKRPTSQARSRNDFFNLVRKKSMASPASADSATEISSPASDTGSLSPSCFDKHAEMEVMSSQPVEVPLDLSPNIDCLSEEKAGLICNGDACDVQKCAHNGKKHPSSDPIISEEEEAAFLRSMGWEENNEEEGLTEEEISAFYRGLTKYINSKSSPRILQLLQLSFLTPFDSQLGDIDELSSELSSSDDKLKS